MQRKMFVGFAVLAVVLMTTPAWAEQSTEEEEETHTTFQVQKTINGVPHVLLGVGAREATALKVNVYGAGLYVGIPQATKAWQSYLTGRFSKAGLIGADGAPDFAKLRTHRELRHFVVYGNMPRAIEMQFVRNVTAEQVTGAYEESWTRVKLDRTAAGEALSQFMAAVNNPMTKGQTMSINTIGNTINVQMPAGSKQISANVTFVRAIWQIWFGEPCLQAPLRDGMLSNVQRLHDLASGS
jgi:hypothetical protein